MILKIIDLDLARNFYGNQSFVERNPPIQWPLMSDGKCEMSMKGRRRSGQSDKMTALWGGGERW